MFFSFSKQITLATIAVAALIAVASAGYLEQGGYEEGGYEQHLETPGLEGGEELLYEHGEHHEDHYAHPKYKFNYAVHDPHTGDEKQHVEERDGDEVKGTYSLKEADGTTRIVEYKADKHNGFNAVVHKIGHPHAHVGHEGGFGGGHF